MDWKLGAVGALVLFLGAAESVAQESDGEGDWYASIRSDAMTDAVVCSVMPSSLSMPRPMFYYKQGAGASLTAIGGDFPGRPLTVRVDSNKAESDTRSISGERLNRLVAQIRAGGRLMRVRAYQWPNDYPVDSEWQLSGLAEKLDECRAAVKRAK